MNLRPPDPKSGALTKLRYTPAARANAPVRNDRTRDFFISPRPKNRIQNEERTNKNINKVQSQHIPRNPFNRSSPRPISTGQLNTLPYLHTRPIYLVVCKGPYYLFDMGNLILRAASRLDAFSVYPCRIWLLCHGSGTQQIHQ